MNVSNFRNSKGNLFDAAYHPAKREDVLVLLGHGVTGNKDRPLLVGISKELAKREIPSIRFSFSGNGKSEGKFEDASIDNEVADLTELLEQLPKNKTIAYLGHSMGGAVGVMVAAQNPERIQYLISLAGMVDTAGFFAREFGEIQPGSGFMWDKPECPFSLVHLESANAVSSTIPYAEKVTQPWLLIHGTEDDLVPVRDSQEASNAANTKVELLELPGEDHLFSEKAYPVIADAIAKWIG